MAEFMYHNTKNANTGYIPFELNYGLYFQVLFEENINPYLRFCFVNKLAEELRELIEICF